MDGSLIKHRFNFMEPGIHCHFRPHHTQNHFHGFLDKEYPSRRRPLLPGVCRNSTIPVPMRSSCSGGSTLPLVSLGFDEPITGKSRDKVDPLSLNSLYFPLFLSFSLFFPPKLVGSRLVKRIVLSLATCHPLSGSLDYTLSTYP